MWIAGKVRILLSLSRRLILPRKISEIGCPEVDGRIVRLPLCHRGQAVGGDFFGIRSEKIQPLAP